MITESAIDADDGLDDEPARLCFVADCTSPATRSPIAQDTFSDRYCAHHAADAAKWFKKTSADLEAIDWQLRDGGRGEADLNAGQHQRRPTLRRVPGEWVDESEHGPPESWRERRREAA